MKEGGGGGGGGREERRLYAPNHVEGLFVQLFRITDRHVPYSLFDSVKWYASTALQQMQKEIRS